MKTNSARVSYTVLQGQQPTGAGTLSRSAAADWLRFLRKNERLQRIGTGLFATRDNNNTTVFWTRG